MLEPISKSSLIHFLPTRTRAGLFLLFLTFLIFAFPFVNDPDFGWHLKSGEFYTQTRQMPDHDIFSYTMSDYKWVNHEYAVDSFYYLLYRLGGNSTIFLSLFFLLIAILTYLIVLPLTFKHKLYTDERLFTGIIALLLTRPFFSVRSQVFDWLGLLFVILIWKKYEETSSRRILLWYIPLFILWANIHGGFFIGFALLGFFLCMQIIETIQLRKLFVWFAQQKRTIFFGFGILLTTAASTLLTPYGIHLHQDIINTLSNPTVRNVIQEWKPSTVTMGQILPFTIFVFSFILLLMLEKREKPFKFREAFLILIFLCFAFSSLRFIPFFIFLSLPILHAVSSTRAFFLPMMLLIIFPSFFISTLEDDSKNNNKNIFSPPSVSDLAPHALDNTKDVFYSQAPIAALDYLNTHPMQGNMFNDYDWGGTLIWLFPQYKVFIDGRMPYWKLNNRAIFEDYLTIEILKEGWDKKIIAYDISWFFIKRASPLAAVLATLPEQWDQVYQDDMAVIFVKK